MNRLHIHFVRNLQETVLHFHPQFNIFTGLNGSGKTSVLEAIHLLGVGRSFRSRQIHSVIHYQEAILACFGEISDAQGAKIALGIEKNRQGEVICKVQGEVCARLAEFAKILPLQLMTPDVFKLLQAGSEERRKFLDWGVFHVEPVFGQVCQRYQRLLKQRNAALKQSMGKELMAWDHELALIGEQLAVYRQQYLDSLLPTLARVQEQLLPGALPIVTHYEAGWDTTISLGQALAAALRQDQRMGYTSKGPHRADLLMTVEGFPAGQVLSRGQQKLWIAALYLAQAEHLAVMHGKRCLYLLDDLTSELDADNQQRLLQLLMEQGHQVFLTGVSAAGWQDTIPSALRSMFHVEQGALSLL
ncbi:MAG: DNA replication/repair protein RecF [Candidatus Berkiella sp.]